MKIKIDLIFLLYFEAGFVLSHLRLMMCYWEKGLSKREK